MRWGEALFSPLFGQGPARDAYQRAREAGAELVIRSELPGFLALPWELIKGSSGRRPWRSTSAASAAAAR